MRMQTLNPKFDHEQAHLLSAPQLSLQIRRCVEDGLSLKCLSFPRIKALHSSHTYASVCVTLGFSHIRSGRSVEYALHYLKGSDEDAIMSRHRRIDFLG